MRTCSRWLGWTLTACLATFGTLAHAVDVGDPLQRPALISARATTSMMTAVTRAGDRLIAVGERGIILVSTDNGQTWVQAQVPVSVLLTGVRFATPQRGWAVGHSGVVLTSADGGQTWVKQLDGVKVAELMRASAESSSGDAALVERLRKEAARLVQEGADKPFFDLDVVNDSTVNVVGAFGLALLSEDGGTTWQAWGQRIPNSGGSHLYSVGRLGGSVVLAGEQGALFRSVDKGTTFTEKRPPSKISNFGLLLISERHWLVFGLRGKAFVSEDGGESWQTVSIDDSASLTAGLKRSDGSIVLASQAGLIYVSTDGGHSFKTTPIANPAPVIGMAEAPDGGLILAGVRGVVRVAASTADSKSK